MRKKLGLLCSLVLLACFPAAGQTFEIQQNGSSQPAPQQGKKQKAASAGGQETLGWGASIEVSRQANAAEAALKRGDYSSAVTFAQRAANAAPQDFHLWFLLGYAARLSGQTQLSVNAFQRGLQAQPNSVEGLSGLAQTYVKMGRTDEAKKLLLQVIAANPRRINDLLAAGELFVQTGDYQGAINVLQRGEAIQPSSRAELLMALAYQRSQQPELAKQMLARARSRSPHNPEVLRAVAGYYREIKDFPPAIAALQEIPNKNSDVLAELAYTYQLAGQKQAAADTYAQAAKGAPSQLGLQLAAASAELSVNAFERARGFLNQAASLNPNYYRVHAIRAEVAKAEARDDEAIREYNLALSNLPETPQEGALYPIQLRMSLADLYREQGDEAKSHQQFQAAMTAIAPLNLQGADRSEFLRLRGAIKSNLNDVAGGMADLQEAARLDPNNPNVLLQYGNVLWKAGQRQQATETYARVLALDPNDRWALTSLGYLAREQNDSKRAETYFLKLAAAYPKDYVPYLALGDMYTSERKFAEAQVAYEKAYKMSPTVAMIVAGGANAGIEAHQFSLAEQWLKRAQGEMNNEPHLMRERERYLTWTGNYLESARLGYMVIQKMPNDRDAAVYLGYDLLRLGRYDDLLALTSRYEKILPKEPDLPLLAGYVHKSSQLLNEAADDFSRAIDLGPTIVTAYVNRGYVYNDLQNAEGATADFERALKLDPKDGEAHLGLAFAQLELHHGKAALEQTDIAEKLLGESGSTHLARATAYRQQGLLAKSEKEYRAALKYSPDDLKLQLALADTLYHMRRYDESVKVLTTALRLSPDDPSIYGQMAHAYAGLHNRDMTLRYVQAAEQEGADDSSVLLDTGDALLELGDRDAAMDRFLRALDAPDSDRVQARLAIAKAMVHQGKWDEAHEQVSLAFAESRVGEASPLTAEHLLQAADLMLRMHDFELAAKLFQRAQAAGAADQVVAIGLANTYLAQGNNVEAEAQLDSLGNPADFQENYDYMLAMANVYRQRHQDTRALTAFAHANEVSGQDDTAEQQVRDLAGDEGYRINDKFSLLSDLNVGPVFDDATIYMQDAQLFGVLGTGPLPPPRLSYETRWTNGFRVHQDGVPTISGFFQLRHATGQISLPQETLIVDRDTNDYTWNGALNPVAHIGRNSLMFNAGLQYIIRRDSLDPVDMNQDLFRQFVYMSTSSFFNWLSFSGDIIREAGPFTLRDLHSRELDGQVDFRVGRPWGNTAFVTGYSARDLLFRPLVREWYGTSSYVGLEHKFGQKLRLRGLAQYVRGWRVQDLQYALGQAAEPAADFTYKVNRDWAVDGAFVLSRGMGIHDYDNVHSGIFISYVKPLRRTLNDGTGDVGVDYPLRFSAGVEQETFYNFTGPGPAIWRPVIRLTVF